MSSTFWHYCNSGHVFPVTGNDSVSVKDCPNQDDHVIWDDGTSPDWVRGPFPSEDEARQVMLLRLRGFSVTKENGNAVSFHPGILSTGKTVMVEVSLFEGAVHWVTVHEYADESGWLNHLKEKAAQYGVEIFS